MRKIRFRAWDEELNQMYCGDQIEGESNLNAWLSYGDLAIYRNDDDGDYTELKPLQWTGLVDKNGVEIYEGDVLKIPDFYETPENTNATYHHEQIVFKDGAFCTHNYPMFEYQQYLSEESEVIGNKYEHPHLLESEDRP